MPFASWITWLDGVTRQASGRMCGLPPAIVSASWRDRQFWPFRGSEHRSYPLPLDHRFSPLLGANLAPKQRFRHRLPRHLPASPCGPFMVELFTLPFYRGIPEPGQDSAPAVTSLKAPHAGTRCTNLPSLADPSPVGGFAASREGCSPTSAHDVLDQGRGLSASPPFPEQRYRIERRDYSERQILGNKARTTVRITPTSLRREGQARLRASGSTDTALDGWLRHPLSSVGGRVCRVCCTDRKAATARLHH